MLNIVAIMGRLVADPELKTTQSGLSVCSFTIACERSFANKGDERKADFINIVVWRQTAEFVCKYFNKGSLIAVDGSIQTRNYEDKNGNKRTAFEMVASNVHFGESKRDNAKAGTTVSTPIQQSFEPVQNGLDTDSFVDIGNNEDLPF